MSSNTTKWMAMGRVKRNACSLITTVTRVHIAPYAEQQLFLPELLPPFWGTQLFLLEGWGSEHPVLIGGELAMQSRYESASVPPIPSLPL